MAQPGDHWNQFLYTCKQCHVLVIDLPASNHSILHDGIDHTACVHKRRDLVERIAQSTTIFRNITNSYWNRYVLFSRAKTRRTTGNSPGRRFVNLLYDLWRYGKKYCQGKISGYPFVDSLPACHWWRIITVNRDPDRRISPCFHSNMGVDRMACSSQHIPCIYALQPFTADTDCISNECAAQPCPNRNSCTGMVPAG